MKRLMPAEFGLIAGHAAGLPPGVCANPPPGTRHDPAVLHEVERLGFRAAFEDRRERLSTPERRQISQIVFPNAEEAAAAREKRKSGGVS